MAEMIVMRNNEQQVCADMLEEALCEEVFFMDEEDDEADGFQADQREAGKLDDGLGMFLRDIGQVQLLTPEEEMELAKRSYEGDIEARNELVQANLRLVVSVARKYKGVSNAALQDLIQEGSIGLMKAAERFDYKLGYRFSTYAVWWIRQAISRSVINSARVIRISSRTTELMYRLNREREAFLQKKGRDATHRELAELLNITQAKVQELFVLMQDVESLEKPIGDDGGILSDVIPDSSVRNIEDTVCENEMPKQIRMALARLYPRDAQVIRLRYGLEDGDCHTLDDISARLGISRERVRQIEQRALKNLRKEDCSCLIQDYAC